MDRLNILFSTSERQDRERTIHPMSTFQDMIINIERRIVVVDV
jgi:hypothetical protein